MLQATKEENVSSIDNEIQWIPMLNREMLSKIELEDDDTPVGGIDYDGETAADFCDTVYNQDESWKVCDILPFTTLNEDLKDCGIKPLSLFKLIKKFGSTNILSTVLYGVDIDDYTLEQVILSQDTYLKLRHYNYQIIRESSKKDDDILLNDLRTFTAYDVDLLLLDSYVTAECNWDTDFLDTINLFKEIDVIGLDDGFNNSVKFVLDPLTDPVARKYLKSKNITEYTDSEDMGLYFKRCLGIN